MIDKQVDILIIGGGLIGASLMLALTDAGYDVVLVEAKPFSSNIKEAFDARSLALSPASVRILQMLNVWQLLEQDANPIDKIHISEQRGFGSARLEGDVDKPLGFVVEMQHISRALTQLLPVDKVIAPAELIALDQDAGLATVQTKESQLQLKARLIVAADGANSTVRRLCGLAVTKKIYNQHAVVANIGLARTHQGIAYERFTKNGPMAMLPMNGARAALVWAMPPKDAEEMLKQPEADFLNKLQKAFGYRLGRFTQVGRRACFPLQHMIMPTQVASQVVFVGNAAHTLHPVAGQGFNLGLRDVAMLAQCIIAGGINPVMLQDYQQQRSHDQLSIIRCTDGLVNLFTSQIPGVPLARRLGLLAFDNSPFLKKLLSRYARGYAGVTPDLVCGIPLQTEEIT